MDLRVLKAFKSSDEHINEYLLLTLSVIVKQLNFLKTSRGLHLAVHGGSVL